MGDVSTLLEILVADAPRLQHLSDSFDVSTLLEILDSEGGQEEGGRETYLCVGGVSTLLEILGLVCLVVVGF